MQKTFLVIILFGLILSGCHTTKNTQRIVKDSSVSSSPAIKLKAVDSVALLKQQLNDSINAPLNFTTFYGKAKANLNSSQFSGNATVYIKIQKDSIIWISVTGPLNIEGARILITKDSVKIMNKLENSVQLSSIANLQKLTKLPFSFSDFQNILLGKPVITGSNAVYQISKDSITVASSNETLKYFQSFIKNNLLLGQSNFQTVNNSSVTNANLFYKDYQKVSNIDFSTSRDISVSGSATASLSLNFKEYNFNQPQTFVFTISKNYTIKYE